MFIFLCILTEIKSRNTSPLIQLTQSHLNKKIDIVQKPYTLIWKNKHNSISQVNRYWLLLRIHYYVTKARKSNPYPKGLKMSTSTKKSISEHNCHFHLQCWEYVFSLFFFGFLSLNFPPPKAYYKRTKEQDSCVVVIWQEMWEPFQGCWVPVNKPPRWE